MSENSLKYSLNCQFYAEKVKCDPNDFHFTASGWMDGWIDRWNDDVDDESAFG